MQNIRRSEIKRLSTSDATKTLVDAAMSAIVAHPGLGIALYDRHLRYVMCNETLARVHGVSSDAHVGMMVDQVLPELAPQLNRVMNEVLDTGSARLDVEVSGVVPGSSSEVRRWTASYLPVHVGEEVAGVLVLVTDISARASEGERLALLLQASSILGASLDYETTLADLARLLVPGLADWCALDIVQKPNEVPRALVIAHVDPAKVELGHELRRRFPPKPSETRGLLNVLRTGRSELWPHVTDELLAANIADPEQLRLVRELGMRSALVVPLNARGRTLGAMTLVSTRDEVHYDADDQKLAEEIAARAALAIDNAGLYRDAQEANRAKDEFLGTVSHELRTPLTAILGWAHILRKRKLDEAGLSRGLDIIERNAKSQAQIIEDILDVSRIISGKLRLTLASFDLATALRAAVDVVRPMAEGKEIRIDVETKADVGAVTGDPDRLQQVVWNLLSNAIKFTPKGGRVEASLTRVGNEAVVCVRDSGKGITPEFLPHVFERFRQADSSASRSHGGLGLGLSIVRHIVELHGGTVRAESEGVDKGAAFFVTLPCANSAAARRSSPIPTPPTDPGSFTKAVRLDGLKVLVVDDEADARDMIATVLRESGAEVALASSAAEALGVLSTFRPDVLVSDIGMPGEDGYSLIRKVRGFGAELGRVPAVALTAYARADDARRAFLAGYQMHVAKPVEPATLTAVVANLGGRVGAAD